MSKDGQIIGGTYRVLYLIGKGGMGSVYKAERITTREPVAIKFMKVEFIEEENSLERFKREIEILKSVRHPNVVYVFDWFCPAPEEPRQPYIVMEYLEGESLIDMLKREKQLDTSTAITIMLQVLDALGAAHDAGVVHRDLGPQNVFLVKNPDGKPRVKLLDFGLAKPQSTSRNITRVGTVLGRVTYAAPEHFLGKPTDERSDIFSSGMMMMRMLAGRLPYKETRIETLWAERRADSKNNKEYPSAQSFTPDIPDFLDQVVSRAIKKKPEEGYQDALEMQADLMEVEIELDADEPTAVYMPKHSEHLIEFLESLDRKRKEGPEDETETGAFTTPGSPERLVDVEEGSGADARSIEAPGSIESQEKSAEFLSFSQRMARKKKLWIPLMAGFVLVIALVVTAGVVLYSGLFRGGGHDSNMTIRPGKSNVDSAADEFEKADTVGLKGEEGSSEEAAGKEPGGEKEDEAGSGGDELSAVIQLAIRNAPPGAVVRVGEQMLEGVPLKGELPRGDTPLNLEIMAEGYATYVKTIIPNKDLEVYVDMRETEGVIIKEDELPPAEEKTVGDTEEEVTPEKKVASATRTKSKKEKGGKKKKTAVKKKKAERKVASKKKTETKAKGKKKEKVIKGRLGTTISTDYED